MVFLFFVLCVEFDPSFKKMVVNIPYASKVLIKKLALTFSRIQSEFVGIVHTMRIYAPRIVFAHYFGGSHPATLKRFDRSLAIARPCDQTFSFRKSRGSPAAVDRINVGHKFPYLKITFYIYFFKRLFNIRLYFQSEHF